MPICLTPSDFRPAGAVRIVRARGDDADGARAADRLEQEFDSHDGADQGVCAEIADIAARLATVGGGSVSARERDD